VPEPEITVAVPSHERALRLRWLLNALEEQTLGRERFEVIVCFDDAGEETRRLLDAHPVRPRAIRLAPGTGRPARQRNAAWRAARAPAVLFTDDDCRPPSDWLERALAAVRAHPGAVVQGAVEPEPDEAPLLAAAPHARSLEVHPPVPWGQCANIAYPRALLERLGGFDEAYTAAAGEDADLALRAMEAGVPYVGVPGVLTYHAVVPGGLRARLRSLPRWENLVRVVRRHPRVRREMTLRVFWKPSHAWFAAVAAALAVRRRGPAALAAAGWAVAARPRYGSGPRGVLRAATELPGRAVVDAVEVAVLARGSLRHRSLLL
jgi:GT2 family glycosyltransferase